MVDFVHDRIYLMGCYERFDSVSDNRRFTFVVLSEMFIELLDGNAVVSGHSQFCS